MLIGCYPVTNYYNTRKLVLYIIIPVNVVTLSLIMSLICFCSLRGELNG